MATGYIGPRVDAERREEIARVRGKPFESDAEALAAYHRALMQQPGQPNPLFTSDWSGNIDRAGLLGTSYKQANELRRAQGGLATALAASNRSNPYAALGAAQQTMMGMDYEGARKLAVEAALKQYDALLQQKQSRDAAILAAQQGLSDQMTGSAASGLGALLAQYAASRNRAAGRTSA